MTNNDNLCPMMVSENEDGSFTLEWDEHDPRCYEVNTWSRDDFVEAITTGVQETLLEKRDDEL